MQNPSMETIGIADLQYGLYVLHSNVFHASCNSVSTNDGDIWHMRLGHPSHKGLQTIAKVFPFVSCKDNVSPCDSCHFSKQRKLPFLDSVTCTNDVFDILHADLWGPFSTISMLGHKYFLTLVNDHSRFTWVIFLKTKDETRDSLINFVAYVEKQFNKHIKCLRSDNGTEFLALHSFLSAKGILHQKSCVETPQQNGIVERKHQHILNVARALHFQSNVPLTMWNFCVQQAIHVINRLPTPLLKLICPYEILYQEPPSLIHLKVFGCLSYATSLMAHRTKFDPRAHKAIFIGYKEGTKGYILYDLTHHNIFVSRHVIFYENIFPSKSQLHSQDSQSSAPPCDVSTNPDLPLFDDTVPIEPLDNILPTLHPSDNTLSNIPDTPNSGSPSNLLINDNISSSSPVHNSPPSSLSNSPTPSPVNTNDNNSPHCDQPPIRHSTRVSNPPSYLADYHCFSTSANSSSSKILYPLSSVLSYNNCSPDFHLFVSLFPLIVNHPVFYRLINLNIGSML